MTKSTITREQLEEWVAQLDEDGGCDATDRQLEALIRQSLAAMDSEPVILYRQVNPANGMKTYWAELDPEEFRHLKKYTDENAEFMTLYRHAQPVLEIESEPVFTLEVARADYKGQKLGNHFGFITLDAARELKEGNYQLYTAQPAPVVPDENTLRIQGIEALEEFLTATTVEPEMLGGIKLTLACCRALKAIIKNKGWADFNNGKPEKVKAETIITALREPHHDACRAAMLAAAPQSPGSEPATVPGEWIPVSEQMPEEGGRYWCYVEEQNSLGKSHYQWNCSWDGNVWSDKALTGRVTHWMPMPSAPQEDEK